MDEHKLADAFRDAVRETPPASFDTGDVVTASRRVTARRRRQLAAGSALGVVLLAGGLAAGTGLLGTGQQNVPLAGSPPSVSGSAGMLSAHNEPNGSRPRGATPLAPNTLAGPAPGHSVTPQSGVDGCGGVDADLAAALATELPSAAASTPAPAEGSCPSGARAVAVPVQDGATSGVVTVVLVPAANAGRAGPGAGPAAVRAAHGGGTLTVASRSAAAQGAAPYADQLDRIATDLAARF